MSINHVQVGRSNVKCVSIYSGESTWKADYSENPKFGCFFFWIKFDSEISECSKSANFNRNQFLTTVVRPRDQVQELDQLK